jgi:hypothetical protein
VACQRDKSSQTVLIVFILYTCSIAQVWQLPLWPCNLEILEKFDHALHVILKSRSRSVWLVRMISPDRLFWLLSYCIEFFSRTKSRMCSTVTFMWPWNIVTVAWTLFPLYYFSLGLCTGTWCYRKDRCFVHVSNQTVCTYIFRYFVPVLHSLYFKLFLSHKYAKYIMKSELRLARDWGLRFGHLLINLAHLVESRSLSQQSSARPKNWYLYS